MMVAAKTLASAALELLTNPTILREAKDELDSRRSKTQQPVSVLKARQPPPKSIGVSQSARSDR